MHLSPLIPPLVGVVFIILAIGMLLRASRQPQLVGYILAGVVIGPSGLALVPDYESPRKNRRPFCLSHAAMATCICCD